MLGRHPRAVLGVFQALVVSSIEIHCEHTTSLWQILLNSSIAEESLYQGSVSFFASSAKISGKKRRKSFHLLKGINYSKWGMWHKEGHTALSPSSSSSTNWSFIPRRSDPLQSNSAAPIFIARLVRNSLSVKSRHLASEIQQHCWASQLSPSNLWTSSKEKSLQLSHFFYSCHMKNSSTHTAKCHVLG